MSDINEKIKILESGDIFFFYRPKVEIDKPKSESDIQRFYVALHLKTKISTGYLLLAKKSFLILKSLVIKDIGVM